VWIVRLPQAKKQCLRAPLQRDGHPDIIREVELRDAGYPIALGWRLSQMTRLLMSIESSDQKLCEKAQGTQAENTYDPVCTTAAVYRQLQSVLE
jgi:hypothetical protein